MTLLFSQARGACRAPQSPRLQPGTGAQHPRVAAAGQHRFPRGHSPVAWSQWRGGGRSGLTAIKAGSGRVKSCSLARGGSWWLGQVFLRLPPPHLFTSFVLSHLFIYIHGNNKKWENPSAAFGCSPPTCQWRKRRLLKGRLEAARH